MRTLKHHEQRLLKKVNFFDWKRDQNTREVKILRRYGIQDREDYHKYNKICGLITKLVAQLRTLPEDDPFRLNMTERLCKKLIDLGVISKDNGLTDLDALSASRFCRRRLSTVLVTSHFCENIEHAISMIEGGHIRVGPDLVTNSAVHVTREMADNITWAEGSSMKRKIREFRNEIDDFELLGN